MPVGFPMTWSFHHTICDRAILNAWLFFCLYHTMYICPQLRGVGVSILFGFAVSGTVLVVCCCDNNLPQEYDIQHLAQYDKGYMIFNVFKVSRVLTTYSVTFLSRIMIIEKLCIVKLTVIPVFFICL